MFDTFFQKKTLYASITGLFVGLILLCCPFFIYADSTIPFSDDFNSYNVDQQLWGQGNWLESSAWTYVRDENCFEGKCARLNINHIGNGTNIHKIGDTITDDGSWIVRLYQGGSDLETYAFGFDLYNSGASRLAIISNSDNYGVSRVPDLYMIVRDVNAENVEYVLLKEGIPTLEWFSVICEWRNLGDPVETNRQIRCKYDTDDWTGWRVVLDSGIFNVKQIFFRIGGGGDAFDLIGDGSLCSNSHCSACTTGETCLVNNCIWDYNTAYERWECHQEWIPYIPGCGTGFQESCYGCYTQETCESAIPTGVCEWVDRGYGTACYPTEEVPEEAVWEVPTLEECGELSGVEKWLCEIKNWLAGLFMPTQEKVNNLKETIDNFKAKFPFNYANSLGVFFDTIKTSLATPKDIPVEIFGNPGNLNFDFLEASGTIGGTSETIKNILFDFSTALIIIGFLFWIISFIKRIF